MATLENKTTVGNVTELLNDVALALKSNNATLAKLALDKLKTADWAAVRRVVEAQLTFLALLES